MHKQQLRNNTNTVVVTYCLTFGFSVNQLDITYLRPESLHESRSGVKDGYSQTQ